MKYGREEIESPRRKRKQTSVYGRQKPRAPGDKLMNEMSAKKAYREKFRHGKANNELTKEEKKLIRKKQLQGRRAIGRVMAVKAELHRKIEKENKDENVGIQTTNEMLEAADEASSVISYQNYSHKLGKNAKDANRHSIKGTESSSDSLKKAQRKFTRKNMQRTGTNSAGKRTAEQVKKVSGKAAKKVEGLIAKLGEMTIKAIASNPEVALVIVLILFVIMIVASSASTFGLLFSSLGNSTAETSFTAEDADILAVEADYKAKEHELQEKINNFESDHPGYDEYQYSVAEINHNPYELAALLTIIYEAYTEDEVQECLDEIFEFQYKLTTQEWTETRTRRERRSRTVTHSDGSTSTEYYYVTVEYECHIIKAILTNVGMKAVARKMGFTNDEMERFNLLVEMKGNKGYLFADDPYTSPDPGEDDGYDVPPEALTDTKFANMLREAEKHLGLPYVWGGYSPRTGFDCSGFVSWVINHCGNGWNVGRQTANGLLGHCTRVSKEEAKPGDLIFFKGTYATSGASHVGIYVGDGMMIHCGNPIQYTSINTTYWKRHFYTFGRFNG